LETEEEVNVTGATEPKLISTTAVAVVAQVTTSRLSTGSKITVSTGGAIEMAFTPLHWVSYWLGGNLRRMSTAMVCLPSGIKQGTESDSIMPYVSMCGMYLVVKLLWPAILYNFNSMNIGWQSNNKQIDDNHRVRMMLACEISVENVCKTVKVANSQKMYALEKNKLDFEVDRIMVHKLVLVDENNGLFLQAILKEAKKDEDHTEHVLDLVCVGSEPPSCSSCMSFDASTSQKKCKTCY
jgi:hypothetical protein